MIEIKVKNQDARKVNDPVIASSAQNFASIKVEFSSEWKDLNKKYQFRNNNKASYEVVSNEDTVFIPQKALLPGDLYVSICGIDIDNKVKATTNYLKYRVHNSLLVDCPENASDVDFSVIDQIANTASEAKAVASDALSVVLDLESRAGSGEFNGKDGESIKGDPGKSPLIGEGGTWEVWDSEEDKYVDTGIKAQGQIGATGADGFSPVISEISSTDTEYIISFKDAETTFTSPNLKGNSPKIGENGNWFVWDYAKGKYTDTSVKAKAVDGINGKDGVKGEKGDVGEKGEQGLPGAQGLQGEKGIDGYTPQKGVDYFTAEDIQELGIADKVDKVAGKGLSTNDFINDYKIKIDTIKTDGLSDQFLAADGMYHIIQVDGNSIVYFDHEPTDDETNSLPNETFFAYPE